jgi:hypothetical protein
MNVLCIFSFVYGLAHGNSRIYLFLNLICVC